jgi:hypothetical protein
MIIPPPWSIMMSPIPKRFAHPFELIEEEHAQGQEVKTNRLVTTRSTPEEDNFILCFVMLRGETAKQVL